MNGRLKNWLKGEPPILLLELALLAALGAALAQLTWGFAAPKAIGVSAHASAATRASHGDAKRGLFGEGNDVVAVGSGAKLRLVGVASRKSGDAGRAVFVLEDGKSRAARSGESILPGTVLREVHPDYVLLERGGARERLTLERRNAGR
jgi:general secretion pathway protein C